MAERARQHFVHAAVLVMKGSLNRVAHMGLPEHFKALGSHYRPQLELFVKSVEEIWGALDKAYNDDYKGEVTYGWSFSDVAPNKSPGNAEDVRRVGLYLLLPSGSDTVVVEYGDVKPGYNHKNTGHRRGIEPIMEIGRQGKAMSSLAKDMKEKMAPSPVDFNSRAQAYSDCYGLARSLSLVVGDVFRFLKGVEDLVERLRALHRRASPDMELMPAGELYGSFVRVSYSRVALVIDHYKEDEEATEAEMKKKREKEQDRVKTDPMLKITEPGYHELEDLDEFFDDPDVLASIRRAEVVNFIESEKGLVQSLKRLTL